MKTPYLDNLEAANMRLRRTIVMHGGRPVYIQEIMHHDLEVFGTDLLTGKDQKLPSLRRKSWDFRPVRLGYVNFAREHAAYLRRVPARRWKQGLDCDQLPFRNEKLTSPALARTILGQYPSFEKAVERTDAYEVDTAFHKDWAVSSIGENEYVLKYRDRHVGEVNDELEYHLLDKYEFLEEALQEAVNDV